VAYFFFLSIINEITWISSLGFFVIYLAFIIYVICIEKRKRTKTKNNWAMIREKLIYKDEEDFNAIETKRKKIEAIYEQIVTFYLLKSIIVKRKNKGLKRGLSKKFTTEGLMESVIESVVSDDSRIIKENALNDEGEEDQDNSLFAKVMRIYNAPLFFIRNLTMPPFEKDKWNVYFAAATPIFGLLFLIWQVKLINQFNENKYLWIASGVVAGSLSLFIYCKGRKENLAETHGGKLAAISFIVSTLWLNLIAICFIDLLGLIKVLSGLPLGYLSLTLLAWGNSLADVFIDYVISKSGHGKMAVIGVYGGQLFNLFIGFGGSMLLQTLKRPVVLDIYVFHGELLKENILTLVLLASLVISLVATLFAGKWKNWVIGKNLMYFMLIFYLLFFLVVTLVTLFV